MVHGGRLLGIGLGLQLLACNSISGLSDYEKVDCTSCSGSGGAAGAAGVEPETIMVGRKTSCMIFTDKTVSCWGANPGVLPGSVATTPVKVNLTDVQNLTIGLEHVCAVHGEEGSVSCWGRNDHGQLGDGTTDPSPEPKQVLQLPAIDTVSVGATHTCVYTSPDVDPVQAYCWGDNTYGQLGDGGTVDSLDPVSLYLGGTAKIVRIGPGSGYTCAIVDVATLLETWCWGQNDKGQCGQDPVTTPIVAAPAKIETLPQMERVYPGFEHVCGRTVGNKIPWCWGANDHGQVGINAASAWESPSQVLGGQTIDTMFVGYRHTCYVENTSILGACWGANDYGQFGGALSADVLSVAPAPYLDNAAVSMRQAEHGCRILDGVTTCWGANDSGQLGNGKTEPYSPPVEVVFP